MKKLLMVAALGEAATGLVLLVYPPIVVRLLFGAEIAGAGIVMSRIAGTALMGLGVACWPGPSQQPSCGLLTYSTLAMLYLIVVGVSGPAGILLWPAVVMHAGLCVFLVAVLRKQSRTLEGENR